MGGKAIQLRFGTVLKERPSVIVAENRPFLIQISKVMEEAMSSPVAFKSEVFLDAAALWEAMKLNSVDVARLEAQDYIEIKKDSVKTDLAGVESKKGSPFSQGVIAVHEESVIQTAADLRGTDIAFGKPKSLLGQYLPQYLLMKQNLMASDLGSVVYEDSAEEIARQIDLGMIHAGVLSEDDFNRCIKKGRALRIIASFKILNPVWVVRGTIERSTLIPLSNSFVELRTAPELKKLDASGLLNVTDQDFDEMRIAMWSNWLFNPVP